MRNSAFFVLLVASLMAACLPESTGMDNTFEIQDVRIDTIRIAWSKDTVSRTDSWSHNLVAIYRTGVSDCFEYDSAGIDRIGDTLFVQIWEKAYTRRTCLEREIRELRQIPIPGTLNPGVYQIFANHRTGDTLKSFFVVTE